MNQNESAAPVDAPAEDRPNLVPHPSSKATHKPKKPGQKTVAVRKDSAAEAKPERYLPSERITFRRQLDLLRGYAAASNDGGKSVTNKEVATFVEMTESTASIANAFFIQNGFLTKAATGLLPNADVIAFKRAHSWDAATAAHKLAPTVQRSWFGQALLPRLSMSPLEEDRAIQVLAEAANALPKYKQNLRILLEYMSAAGLIVREGTQIRAARNIPDAVMPVEEETMPASAELAVAPDPVPQGAGVQTMYNQSLTSGVIQFQINVRVDLKEISGWRPERIAAFFSGIAQVVAAKGQLERNVSGDS